MECSAGKHYNVMPLLNSAHVKATLTETQVGKAGLPMQKFQGVTRHKISLQKHAGSFF